MHPLRKEKLRYLLENMNDSEIDSSIEIIYHFEPRFKPSMGIFSFLSMRRLPKIRAHWVGGHRVAKRLFSDARHERTPWVILSAILGMTAVIITTLITLRYEPKMLLAVPAYGIYMMIIMVLRARVLASQGNQKYSNWI